MTVITLNPAPASSSEIAYPASRISHRLLMGTMPVIAFLTYIAFAVWMRAGLGYGIGDALSRSSSARAVLFSHSRSLTAIGLVWMPLPALAELPFTLVLEPFGWAEYAGPLMTAGCGAVALRMMLGTFERLGLAAGISGVLAALYAFNPVIAFHAADGMSEAVFFVALIWLMRAYFDWVDQQSPRAMIAVSMSLALAMAARYESLLLVPVMALLVGMKRPTWTRRLLSASVAGFPAAFVFFLWLAANQQIMGSATFWRTALNVMAKPPPNAPWLPIEPTTVTALAYALKRSLLMAPGLVLLVPYLVMARGRSRLPAWALLGAGAVFPAFIVYLLPRDQTWGNIRYFAPLIPVLVLSAGWMLSRGDSMGRSLSASVGGQTLLVVLVAIGVVTGTAAMASPDITPVESEWQVFRPALGIDIGTNAPTAVGVWRATTKQIDQVLADHGPDSRILTNMGSAFPVFLLTDRPGSFILDHDPDHEPTVAAGFRGIDIVFIAPGSTEGTLRAALGSDPSANWKATDAAVGTIYERRDSTPKR